MISTLRWGTGRRREHGNYPGEEPNPFVNEWRVFMGALNAHEHTERCPVPANATPKRGKLHSKPLHSRAHSQNEPEYAGVCQNGPEYACGPCHWGLRWSSLWGYETCEGCAKVDPNTHAGPATGAFGGAPYGATKRVRGVPKWGGGGMRTLPLGPSVELPMGPRTV